MNILEKISEGRAYERDLDHLRRISHAMQKASLCGLGQTAANPVLSTLRFFEEEYRRHVIDKKCASGKCRHLRRYAIVLEKCKKCGLCLRNCPVKAISGDREKGYVIDEKLCTRCGQCVETCKFKAVIQVN